MATRGRGEQLSTSRAQRREEVRVQRKQEKRERNAGLRGAALASSAALSLGAGLLSQPVEAATFTVLNNLDGGEGSLRAAISNANGAAGADTIVFDAGVTGSIVLTTGQLSITDSVDIQGPGAATLTVSGNNASRVFYLYSPSANIAVSISGLTITGGAASRGAGINNLDEDLTLDGVVVSGNTATSDGGGLWADGFSMDLTIRNSTISGNSSGSDGGGIYVEDTGGPLLIQNTTISGNSASSDGGGVYFYDPDSDVTIETSTISGNSAGGSGGGIYLYDTDGGTFTIRNSTIANNTASSDGGGVYFEDPDDPVVIELTTISGNTASGAGGGVAADSGPITVLQSIIADNSAASDSDVNGGTFEVSFSLIEDPGGASITDNGDNVFNQDPQLGPLQDNGGSTETQAIPDTSPAFDAAGASCLATDQRGVSRPQFTDCDMGAFELEPALSTDPCDTATPTLGCIVNDVLNQPCVGTPGKDVIIGTSGNDVIFGGGGNDELRGNEGDDLLCGEGGNDILIGATGNDILIGGAGKDVLRGEVGDDVLDGGSENDRLLGGPGNDDLTGGDGIDTLRGDAGTDTCDGEKEIACEL
ncbi:MAG: right-handed parallel beta-helix repeat-containing protein [Deltaproteobacteria bacterium]|nr:right-handed parallel beta-helix repeat-containing protein [Deltaproteobacteria bacterium]